MTPPPQTRRTAGDCGFALHDLPADPASASDIRRRLTHWLTENPLTSSEQRSGDIVLAVYEAVANAAEHAYRAAPRDSPAQSTIAVDTRYRERTRTLQIAVTDHGQWKPAVPTRIRGRGLILIRALADHADVDTGPTGTTVTMHWRLFS